jgi:pimeloyl-ACP methyl ester carboxylesterase
MAEEQTDRLSVDAGGRGLLAHLNGEAPPAPDWFRWAVSQAPERARVQAAGAMVEALAWGERGKPGLLLLHGNGAHADWWSFIAPFFAADFRVVAPTWTGMGNSDWRDTYGVGLFVAEAMAACEALGLFEGPAKPMIAAHSFGGYPALGLAHAHGHRFSGVLSMDSPVEAPGLEHGGPPPRSKGNRVYGQFHEALARFRLAPEQPCENLYAVDHIARRSIKAVDGGYTWKFDPFIWRKFEDQDALSFLKGARCPIAVMWGAQSALMGRGVLDHMRSVLGPSAPFIPIPDAAHHLMLDQPIAIVAAMRALFAAWPRRD